MKKLALVPIRALLPILSIVSACGPVRNIPIELINGTPVEDSLGA